MLIVNKNNNFLSLKLNLVLNFETTNKNITKKGTSIPICFPKNNPNKIPNGTGANNEFIDIPSSETPAFAKANRGIIPKAT